MSWVRVWVHAVFTTKNRKPLLLKSFRQELFRHIKTNAKKKELIVIEVNGSFDHVHVLFSLNRDMSISKTLQLIKGESSYWLNKQGFSPAKILWQDDYWAVGVSESHLKQVQKYVLNQEIHHKKTSFNEEMNLFMEKYNWKLITE